MRVLTLAILACVLAACSQREPQYTGKLKIDSMTEYVALDQQSPIGGRCSGWQAVAIQKPGQPHTAMINLICWKRVGDDIVISSAAGGSESSAPARLWSD